MAIAAVALAVPAAAAPVRVVVTGMDGGLRREVERALLQVGWAPVPAPRRRARTPAAVRALAGATGASVVVRGSVRDGALWLVALDVDAQPLAWGSIPASGRPLDGVTLRAFARRALRRVQVPPETEEAPVPVPVPVEAPPEPPPPEPALPVPPPAEAPVTLEGDFVARRRSGGLNIDGVLDEPDWALAPVFDRFVQSFPQVGASPSERTEVRVLFDDAVLYVGIRCHDSLAAGINARLALRDNSQDSDGVQVEIDSQHGHRNGYLFGLNAGGVQEDGLLHSDNRYAVEWDGAWDGVSTVDAGGWTAELAIPLSLLRFASAESQTWGFAVRRVLSRNHEQMDSVLLPKDLEARVSRYGHLAGLGELRPRRAFSVTSYLAPRFTLRPLGAGERRVDPALDLGVDAALALTSELRLTGTVNPDFGQVEADTLVLNFSAFEVFLPEKRPFFTEGMDLFEPVAVNDFPAHQLFYSRRVGLVNPLFAAAKLSGAVGGEWRMSVLEAVEADAQGSPDERRVRFHPERPLHFAPEDTLPAVAPAERNAFALVARGPVHASTTVGATLASSLPLTRRCPAGGGELSEEQAEACAPWGQHALALDVDVRSANAAWRLVGQLDASLLTHGPDGGRTLLDGTVLRRGTTGLGAFVRGGLLGGEPWRFNVGYEYASPTLELNHIGYLRTQNEQTFRGTVEYVRPSGVGVLHALAVKLEGAFLLTTDGRKLPRDNELHLTVELMLPGFTELVYRLYVFPGGYNVRMGAGGLAVERPLALGTSLILQSDPNRALSGGMYLYLGRNVAPSNVLSRDGFLLDFNLRWTPHPRLTTEVLVAVGGEPEFARWLASTGEEELFGELEGRSLTVTLRQLLVLTPRLSLQLYAQLLTGYGQYGPFYSVPSGSDLVPLRALRPAVATEDPSFDLAELNLSVRLRYEYRPGSALFLMYSRTQAREPPEDGEASTHWLSPAGLFSSAAADTVLLKWIGATRFDL